MQFTKFLLISHFLCERILFCDCEFALDREKQGGLAYGTLPSFL